MCIVMDMVHQFCKGVLIIIIFIKLVWVLGRNESIESFKKLSLEI